MKNSPVLWPLAAMSLFLAMPASWSAPGDWPEPRQNPHLTASQSQPGNITAAPRVLGSLDLGRSIPNIVPVQTLDDGATVGIALHAGALYCYDTTGALRWRTHPPGINFDTLVACRDLNGDGTIEILLESGRPGAPYGAVTLVALETGELLWRYDVDPMSYVWHAYAGHYLPDTATEQVIVMMHGYPPDKENGYIALFGFEDATRAPMQRWRYNFDAYTCMPYLLQSDLDGDGVKEIVAETHSRMWFFDALEGTVKHFAQWEVSPGNVRSYGLTRFADLDKDGDEDFLCIANFSQHHEVLFNIEGKMEKAWHYGWPESVTTGKVATTWPEPPYADVDGDGAYEVVVSMFNGDSEGAWAVRVYDALTGSIKYKLPGLVAIALEDVNGDGQSEILANACASPTRSDCGGAVCMGLASGEAVTLWQASESSAAFSMRGAKTAIQTGGEWKMLGKSEGNSIQWLPFPEQPSPTPPDFSKVSPIAGPGLPQMLAADLLGDPVNEVVLYQNPSVRVLAWDGQGLAESAVYTSSSLPVIADLDDDGHSELVLSDIQSGHDPVVWAITTSLENKQLWKTSFPVPGRPGLPQPRAAYLRAGHFTGREQPDIYVWAGTPVVRSAVLAGRDGAILWDKGETPGLERYWGPSVDLASVYDFDDDGEEDLVFTNPDYYCIASGPTGEPLLGPLFPPEIFDQPCQGLYTLPAILEEANAPPSVCLVEGHYFQAAMRIDATPHWYKIPLPGENPAGPEAFLPTPDGAWLMGFGRQNGNFACVNVSDGSLRWEFPLEASATGVVSGDLNGDGAFEFLIATSHGTLYAIGARDGEADPKWHMDLGAALGDPILTDVTGDGLIEILVGSADGFVHVIGD